jgi:hypothetical protein
LELDSFKIFEQNFPPHGQARGNLLRRTICGGGDSAANREEQIQVCNKVAHVATKPHCDNKATHVTTKPHK